MTITCFRALAILAAWALLAPLGIVQAQEIQLASHAEMNNLYARLAELESRIAATNVSGCGCADAANCGNGCGDCCDDCCKAGWVAGAELAWLKAFHSNGDFGDFNYDEAFRFWLGYQGAGGLGVRMRFFDADLDAANGDFVDVRTVDLEVYDTFELGCNWDLLLAGGLRYADVRANDGGGAAGDTEAIFGTGPVLTAELYRHISDRAALYAIGRQSILAGGGLDNGAVNTDRTTFVSELQLGLQVHRDWNGGLAFARAGWEAQYYDAILDGDESVCLMGGVLSVGLMR
jgi:hypothetical protein